MFKVNIVKITWKNCLILAEFLKLSFRPLKIDDNWANYVVEFNESLQYYMKFFLGQIFQF